VLTPDIVLMGLNRSDDFPAPYANFHAPTRKHYDYRLKEFIQDGGLDRLQGAYMTDLVDDVDPDSQNVEVTDDDAAVLLDQLRLLGESEYHVVCFGNKPFDGLVDYFGAGVTSRSPDLKQATIKTDRLTLSLYRVWFYGLYGVHHDKVDILKHQLQELNEQVA
jgi:aminoglycoside phosphotransferase